jgi:hypothetical protein
MSASRNSTLIVAVLAFSCAVANIPARGAECPTVVVGADTTHADSCFNFIFGGAYGQVFEARDTLIQAISVWRGDLANITPLRIFVVELDASGWPDVSRILRAGPTLQYGISDHPVQYRFVFDPPVALPRPGRYEFAVQPAPPYCDFGSCLLSDTRNPYPDGGAWEHHRSFPEWCTLEFVRPPVPNNDLILGVEFCDAPTAVRRPSWGNLKMRYR